METDALKATVPAAQKQAAVSHSGGRQRLGAKGPLRALGPLKEPLFLDLSRRWANPSIVEVAEIKNGLSMEALTGLNKVLPETTHRIVPKSTLANQKRKSDSLSPEQSDRVYQAGKVFGLAMTIYDTAATSWRWGASSTPARPPSWRRTPRS